MNIFDLTPLGWQEEWQDSPGGAGGEFPGVAAGRVQLVGHLSDRLLALSPLAPGCLAPTPPFSCGWHGGMQAWRAMSHPGPFGITLVKRRDSTAPRATPDPFRP